MAVDKLVDSTQLDSDLTSVANAIRAKSGGSSPLAFPAGFVSEIGNIPSGGGGGSGSTLEGDYLTLRCAIVTVGANSVTNATQIVPYLLGLAGFPTTDYTHACFCVIDHSGSWVNNAAICTALETAGSVLYPASAAKFYRFRNNAAAVTAMGSSYDAKLTSGDKYFVSAFYVEGVPT